MWKSPLYICPLYIYIHTHYIYVYIYTHMLLLNSFPRPRPKFLAGQPFSPQLWCTLDPSQLGIINGSWARVAPSHFICSTRPRNNLEALKSIYAMFLLPTGFCTFWGKSSISHVQIGKTPSCNKTNPTSPAITFFIPGIAILLVFLQLLQLHRFSSGQSLENPGILLTYSRAAAALNNVYLKPNSLKINNNKKKTLRMGKKLYSQKKMRWSHLGWSSSALFMTNGKAS